MMFSLPTYAYALAVVALFHFIVIKNVVGQGVHWLARAFIWLISCGILYGMMQALMLLFANPVNL